jgi:hypothetical protein
MKNLRTLSSIVLLALAISIINPAYAGNSRPYSFFGAMSLNFAVTPEEFTDYYIMGYGGSAGIEYPVGPAWSIIGMLDLKLFGPASGMIKDWWDDEGEYPGAQNIEVSEGQLTAFTIAFLGKGALKSETSRLYPYIKGGFGLTIAGADEIKVTWYDPNADYNYTSWQAGADSETNISIITGFGLEALLGSGNTKFFIDLGLHVILQENTNPNVVPINIGLKF